ncbi:MAG: Lrp/AsnC family transcriptional regulator [Halioglobus sp.]
MTELDSIDQKLLALLRVNSRSSISALARELRVSRTTAQDRIQRLERRRIIAGYTIRYNEAFLAGQISAHVMIEVDPKYSAKVVSGLTKLDAVRTVLSVSGIYDLVAMLEAPTTETMDAVLDMIGQLPGVAKTTSSIVLSTKLKR